MVKSIHDLSEDEIIDLSKHIQELLNDITQKKVTKKEKTYESNSDNFDLPSLLPSIEESKETDENTAITEYLSHKQSHEKVLEMENRKDENKSLETESSQQSETVDIEDLIENDETLKELKKLTLILDNDKIESMKNENDFACSSTSLSTTTVKKETEKFRTTSVDSTIILKADVIDSDVHKTFNTNSRPKNAKEDIKIDKNIPNRKQPNLQFDSKSRNSSSELKKGKTSSSSLKMKKKQLNKDQVQNISSGSVKKKPYTEGSPEYIKRHYVPIILPKKTAKIDPKRETSAISTRSKLDSMISEPEEDSPLFPLKIDCISMFSEDEDEEDGVEEESSTESDSGPEDKPDVMFNKLWRDLLLPTDESDIDLEEFYKQFPKLKKKKKRFNESKEEVFF